MAYITGSGCLVYKESNNQRLMEKVPEVLEGNSENSRWICKSGVDNVGSGVYENVITARSTRSPECSCRLEITQLLRNRVGWPCSFFLEHLNLNSSRKAHIEML